MFARSNHDFVNAYKDLQKEISERHRAISKMPYEQQDKALKVLNAAINEKIKAFIKNTKKVLKL
ncbi:hypothetical protein QIA45_05275 (plasmid) [Borreliella andersonii]|uniref:Uncharacterized protein n=1 Tax=Borrelia andersonii TaxID=42109 RepID=A0ACD5G6C6_BORAD